MNTKNKIKLLSKLILTAFCLGITSNALALGLVADPIIVENVLRGNEVWDTMTIINNNNAEIVYELGSQGEIENWVSFYQKDSLDQEITEVSISPNNRYEVAVKLSVPEDMPNGEYSGQLFVKQKPKEQSGENVMAVAQMLSKEVLITVSDEEIIDFEASIIPGEFDYKEGEAISIRVIYYNHGNVQIKPQFGLKIKKIDTQETVLNVIYPYPENEPAVSPYSSYEIPAIEVSTNGFEDGKYRAEIAISVNDYVVEDDFKFNIGNSHFTATGLLGAISIIGGGNILLAWFIIGVVLVALAVFLALYRKKLSFIKAGINKFRSLF